MKTFAPINIVVHYPSTEDGWRDLKKRVAGIYADAVLNSISKLDYPMSQKEKMLEAIVGDIKEQLNANKNASA